MSNWIDDETVEFELNDKQADFIEGVFYNLTAKGVKTAGIVGGIGSGKSFVMGFAILCSKEDLPMAKGQFACNTVKQFKRSIFPGVKSVWREHFNLIPYNFATGEGDYCLWKEPPQDWDRPWQEPDDWENCISFSNGWVMEVCGYKLNADLHRGRNDDFAFMDEALLFKREWLKILEGRLRANVGKFESNWHHLFAFFSSPSYGSGGDWMYEIEKLMASESDRYYFTTITTRDNVLFLPPNFIENLKKKLLKIEYEVEVNGKRISRLPNCYYPAFDYERHTDLDEEELYDPNQELVTVVDFNAHFTSCTNWQHNPNTHLHRMAFDQFVKEPDNDKTMAQTLAIQLRKELERRKHRKRRIIITGDRNGNNKSAGSVKKADGSWETFFSQFGEEFSDHGWDVVVVPINYNPPKDEVYTLMKDILSEDSDVVPTVFRFSKTYGRSTTTSIQMAPITGDYNKDKGSEKKATTNQENATHLSDTVDYYAVYISKPHLAYSSGSFDLEFM